MNFGAVMKAFDTVVALRDATRMLRGRGATTPAADGGLTATPTGGLGGQIEARLTNVVVAALKEAFDRDHARLDLERQQLEETRRRADEERRRAEAALRMELRRQAAERELSRLRTLAATAMAGWVASLAVLAFRLTSASTVSRAVLGVGWLLLLGGLGAAFNAQGRIGALSPESESPLDTQASALALWLIIAGLALTAVSLLV